MRKLLLLLAVCTVLASACSSNSSKSSVQDTTPVTDQTGSDNRNLTDTMGTNANSAPKDTANLDKVKPDSTHK